MTELYFIRLVLCGKHAKEIEDRYGDYVTFENETDSECDLCKSEKLRESLLGK